MALGLLGGFGRSELIRSSDDSTNPHPNACERFRGAGSELGERFREASWQEHASCAFERMLGSALSAFLLIGKRFGLTIQHRN